MRAPERLETDRLLLRRPALDDVDEIFRYASDPDVTRLLSFPTHRTTDDTRGFLGFSDHTWDRHGAGPYVIVRRVDGAVIGGTGFDFEGAGRASTGYVLARHVWGQGFATETLRAIVEASQALGLQRLAAVCHPSNRASARVLEKCGFVLEGTLRRYAAFPNFDGERLHDALSYSRIFRLKAEATSAVIGSADGVAVRSAAPADAAAWLAMRQALWPDHEGRWHATEIAQFFGGTLGMPLEVLIAEDDDGRALGFAELFIRPYAEGCVTNRVAFLEGWFVAPEARGRGVGRALIAAAEAWARAQGCTEFASDAEIDNETSAAAHRALGFEEVEQIRCFRKSLA